MTTTTHPAATPTKAYSYVRCSTPEQMQGDTFRRQFDLAEQYAAKRGWEIDRTLRLHDAGVSAFRGRNAVEGTLGAFLEHVRSGEISPGSVLLIESLDRLSRQEIDDALWLFLDIIRSDVTIVTLLDEMEYSRESLKGPMGSVSLIVSLFILSRAHEESATKARRLKEAWRAKRKQAVENNMPLTGVIPAWLRLDRKRHQVELIPERAAIVERIFRDTLSGQGQHQIAMRLNGEGVKPWGRGAYWHRSYIAKILSNDAVIGIMTPHTLDYTEGKRTRTPQEPIKGYYPAAVSEALWLDVQAMRTGKVATGRRGVHAANPVTHMLARLAMCPTCGGSMSRVHKGSRSRPSLVCSRARTKAGCTYKSVRIDLLEEAIIDRLPERLRDAPAGVRISEVLDSRFTKSRTGVSLSPGQSA
ncbi:recombinase family protein, partial [Novosphingobium panipatense]|uniref:recombinase family protein n=1 Tax=Novosphingobium panipatense TaxID=428991 RepID=UPI00399FF313